MPGILLHSLTIGQLKMDMISLMCEPERPAWKAFHDGSRRTEGSNPSPSAMR